MDLKYYAAAQQATLHAAVVERTPALVGSAVTLHLQMVQERVAAHIARVTGVVLETNARHCHADANRVHALGRRAR